MISTESPSNLRRLFEDHEAWRLRSEGREEQLQQVRAQRRRVASGIALFGASASGAAMECAMDCAMGPSGTEKCHRNHPEP